jgi:hypothetical protein
LHVVCTQSNVARFPVQHNVKEGSPFSPELSNCRSEIGASTDILNPTQHNVKNNSLLDVKSSNCDNKSRVSTGAPDCATNSKIIGVVNTLIPDN